MTEVKSFWFYFKQAMQEERTDDDKSSELRMQQRLRAFSLAFAPAIAAFCEWCGIVALLDVAISKSAGLGAVTLLLVKWTLLTAIPVYISAAVWPIPQPTQTRAQAFSARKIILMFASFALVATVWYVSTLLSSLVKDIEFGEKTPAVIQVESITCKPPIRCDFYQPPLPNPLPWREMHPTQ